MPRSALLTIPPPSTFDDALCTRIFRVQHPPLDDLAPIILPINPSPFVMFQLGSQCRSSPSPWIPPIRDLRAVNCKRQVVVAVEIAPPSAISNFCLDQRSFGFYSWIRSAAARATLTLESTCAVCALRVSTFRFTSGRGKGGTDGRDGGGKGVRASTGLRVRM